MVATRWGKGPVTGGVFLMFLLMSFMGTPVDATDHLGSQKEALDLIADFADRLCRDVPLGGSETNLELSGEAKAELSNLLKYLASIGIEGSGKYQESKYEGVLQKDLAAMLQKGMDCKLEVFRELKDKLILENINRKEPEDYAPFPPVKITLRSKPGVFSDAQIGAMLKAKGFFSTYLNPQSKGFPNEYEVLKIQGNDIVVDYATGLMWKRSGSPQPSTWFKAGDYVGQLNQERYAGFSSWRVPTIEELASLMEPQKMENDLHIDPLFELGTKPSCWSGDRKVYDTNKDTAWPADFGYGGFVHGGFAGNFMCVLAVRTR